MTRHQPLEAVPQWHSGKHVTKCPQWSTEKAVKCMREDERTLLWTSAKIKPAPVKGRVYPKLLKSVHACRNYSLPKLTRSFETWFRNRCSFIKVKLRSRSCFMSNTNRVIRLYDWLVIKSYYSVLCFTESHQLSLLNLITQTVAAAVFLVACIKRRVTSPSHNGTCCLASTLAYYLFIVLLLHSVRSTSL